MNRLVSIVSESCPSLRVLLRDYTTSWKFVSSSILGAGPGGGQGGAQDEAGQAAGPGRQGGLRRAPRQDGPRYASLSVSLSLSFCPIICVQLHCVKSKLMMSQFVSALRDVKAEFLITSLHVVGWKERDIFLSISSSVSTIREFCCVQVSVQVHYKSYVSIIYNLHLSNIPVVQSNFCFISISSNRYCFCCVRPPPCPGRASGQ